MLLALDVDRTLGLASLLVRWPHDADRVIDLVTEAEAMTDLVVGVTGPIDEMGTTGSVLASALERAVDEALGFRLPELRPVSPRLSLMLDLPVGTAYDPTVANEAIARGETYRQAEIRRELQATRWQPFGRQLFGRLALIAEYLAIDPATPGDLGGTLTTEVRNRFTPAGGSPLDQGRGIVEHALADTGDASQIRVDEFEAIFHDNGKVTLVLPGVIDLSSPQFGYDPQTRSVRDVDQQAIGSSFGTGIGSNGYAQLVFDWVQAQVDSGAIPRGTDVLIVGHSFGADTALDLASDPRFNGGLVNVTHVVPAAYHSEAQLSQVVNGTQVGVLQNIYDVPVIVEGIAHDFVHGNLRGTGSGVGRVGIEAAEEATGWGASFANGVGWVVEKTGETALRNPWIAVDLDIPDLRTDIDFVGDSVHKVGDTGFVAEFEGGFAGVGHHQDNYIGYLDEPNLHVSISEFLTDVGAAGYGAPGTSLAVDVSVPAHG